jgi:hypothetical protein
MLERIEQEEQVGYKIRRSRARNSEKLVGLFLGCSNFGLLLDVEPCRVAVIFCVYFIDLDQPGQKSTHLGESAIHHGSEQLQ